MSEWFRGVQEIRTVDVFDGRLEAYGVDVVIGPTQQDPWGLLTNGKQYLAVVSTKGCASFVRGEHIPFTILAKIEQCFNTELRSYQDSWYYGFANEEEMNHTLQDGQMEPTENHELELTIVYRAVDRRRTNDHRSGFATTQQIIASVERKRPVIAETMRETLGNVNWEVVDAAFGTPL